MNDETCCVEEFTRNRHCSEVGIRFTFHDTLTSIEAGLVIQQLGSLLICAVTDFKHISRYHSYVCGGLARFRPS